MNQLPDAVMDKDEPDAVMDKDEFDSHTWNIIDSYYKVNKGYQIVKHQLESYNDLF